MRKIILWCGVCLVALGVCLAAVFGLRAYKGERQCRAVASQIEKLLPERTDGVVNADSGLPVLEIGGKDYAGLLEIPGFGLTLPVANDWNEKDLYGAPARFLGAVGETPLVIGGADTAYQFGFCDSIDTGAQITFTDMTGGVFTYTVCRVDRSEEAALSWLQKEDYDLTLFCRDTYSLEYIAVRCAFSYQ